jgi:hypothetical protein
MHFYLYESALFTLIARFLFKLFIPVQTSIRLVRLQSSLDVALDISSIKIPYYPVQYFFILPLVSLDTKGQDGMKSRVVRMK